MNFLTRRQFCQKAMALVATTAFPLRSWANSSWDKDQSILEYFDFPQQELLRLGRLSRAGLLSISTVATAPKDSRFRHLGWPVATQAPDGRAVLVFSRGSGHHSTQTMDAPSVGHYALHSPDGIHWSPVADDAPKIAGREGMHCVGWTILPDKSTYRFLAVVSGEVDSLHLSDDGGKTWQIRPDAFDGLLQGAVHCGPTMLRHPDFGLMAVFGQTKSANGSDRRNYLIRTLDGGESWQEHTWENPERNARSVEPAGVVFGEGNILLLSREFREAFGVAEDGSFCHTQHLYRHIPGGAFESVTFDTRRTNIAGNGGAKISALDTPDVIYNPVNGRIEMLQSHRWGPAYSKDSSNRVLTDPLEERSSLNLWSISPEELLDGSATWHFDGTLIERIGYSRKGNKDGLHPGGSIVDIRAGVQRIFVYAGWRRSPSGLFCITRTLDTNRLWR